MVVLDPLKVIVRNYPLTKLEEFQMPNFSTKPELGTHLIKFSSTIYIEASDFQPINVNEKCDFKRLALNQNVGLRHAGFVLSVIDVVKTDGKVLEIIGECYSIDHYNGPKPKAFIHWVSEPFIVVVKLYKQL